MLVAEGPHFVVVRLHGEVVDRVLCINVVPKPLAKIWRAGVYDRHAVEVDAVEAPRRRCVAVQDNTIWIELVTPITTKHESNRYGQLSTDVIRHFCATR